MTILSTFGGASGVDTGDIGHSLRFRSAGSTRMSRTPAASNQKTFTISFWVRRGTLGVMQRILQTRDNGGSSANAFGVYFTATNTLYVYRYSSALQLTFESSALFRDPTAWYHIVVSIDTTQATASDRAKIYVNGVLQNTPATLPTQNLDMYWNSAVQHNIGCFDSAGAYSLFLDGYIARICSIDGSALTPSSFGYFNTEINEWVTKTAAQVKAVVDAGGTNSFMLDFDDATSLTTLGYDKSSKGNNWTLNNFSLTAGTTYDHMLDVPGNSFCTASPIDLGANPGSSSLTEANLKSACSAVSGGSSTCGTQALPAGKFYFELTPTAIGNGISIGITSRTSGSPNSSNVSYQFDGNKNIAGSASAYGATYANNDIIGVAVDTTANTVEFFKNNTSQGVITNSTYIVPGCKPLHWNNSASGSSTVQHNYGQAPLHASATYHSAAGGYFRYAPPSGYKALCQANMPDPAILNPENGLVSVAATEDNIYSTLASARSGWTDYVDILKNRAAAESWAWQFSHDSSNEYAVSASSLVRQAKRTQSGSNNWVGYSIRIGATYGTAAGSVSHTNGAATTITHNIGKSARQLILLFNRAGGSAVPVYHPDLTSGELLDLCTTAADAASTAITSVGTNSFQIDSGVATGTYDYLVCSEISQFFDLGKWTGNAAADGAYYNADHKPKMLYAKSLSTTDDHRVYDDLRPGYNVQGGVVLANTNAAETTAAEMDITAFGLKARIATTPNAAQTYVTASWASVASKYSLAR